MFLHARARAKLWSAYFSQLILLFCDSWDGVGEGLGAFQRLATSKAQDKDKQDPQRLANLSGAIGTKMDL
jgi:hypothetical protein